MLLALFILGVMLVVIGVLMVCFPKAIDELSNFTGQVILNIENKVSKGRVPFGILIFLLGVLVMWLAQTTTL